MDTADLVLTRHKLDVDEYYLMADAGIFHEDDRVELIDGEVIDMAPIGNDHVTIVDRLTETLVLACGGRAIVRVQNPIRIDRLNEPQPDFTVLRRRADFYASERAGPPDVLLVVEVADSSLRFDRKVKLPLYARAGIAEVWIVDVKQRRIDVARCPAGDGYAELTTHGPGETLSLVLAPDIAIRVEQAFD